MDEANGLSLGAIPFAAKPRGEETRASLKRRSSSFYGDKLAAGLSVSLENAREAAVVVKRLTTRSARRRKKAKAWRRGKCASRSADAANVEARQEAQMVSVDARNVSYQEHVDRLYELIVSETTYTLLVGYNDTFGPEEQFTKGQLKYCAVQCKALCEYFQTIISQNTGDAGSWALLECAQVAARTTYGKALAEAIQGWYNHNYVPNNGLLFPRQTGKYERDSFPTAAQTHAKSMLKIIFTHRAIT